MLKKEGLVTLIEFVECFVVKERFVSAASNISFWQKRNAEHLFHELMDNSWCDSVQQSVFNLLNNIESPPVCRVCDSPTKYHGFKKGYSEYCSSSCANLDPTVKAKKEQTCLKNNGVKNALSDRQKIMSAMLEKHGVDNPQRSESIKRKTRKTHKQRYSAEDITQKVKKTKLEKYGNENYSNIEKSRATCLEKYGATSSTHIARSSFKESYCVENPSQLAEVQKKKKENALKKHGVLSQQRHLSAQAVALAGDIEFLERHSIAEIQSLTGYSPGHISRLLIRHGVNDGFRSYGEREVHAFVRECYSGEIITGTKSVIAPYELDVFIPEHNLAIEFNGDYFHSTANGKTKHYHKNKFDMCSSRGIQLLQIQESEWNCKRTNAIWKSIIRNKLNQRDRVVYARKCQTASVSAKTAAEFLDKNHLQGSTKSSVKLGLYYDDELVMLATFGKCRFGKRNQHELIRLSSRMGYNVVGGASKLIKNFLKENPGDLVSFSDNRYSNGRVYQAIGFDKKSETIGYYYIKNGAMFNRQKFQKHKLESLLDKFDQSLTEEQNMTINGYLKVFDAGQTKWIFENNQQDYERKNDYITE